MTFSFQSVALPSDFSGSHVTSDKPIVVTCGAKYGDVEDYFRVDPYFDTFPPSSYFGVEYILAPFATRTNGYLLKLVGELSQNISLNSIKLLFVNIREKYFTCDTIKPNFPDHTISALMAVWS